MSTIDSKRLGSALLQELSRRSVDKSTDKQTLVEQLNDGSGAHVFVGEKTGEVSLLVPIEDGFDGPKTVNVTVPGNETVVVDVAKRVGTVEVEGVTFARFVLEPLKYASKLDAAAPGADRPQIALRGEGPDGLWSPLGFDDWFLADYNTLRWLATADAVVVAPEVKADPRDPSWKALDPQQRDALETILQRPVAEVVHDTTLQEALKKVKDDGGVVAGALQSLALSVDVKKPPKPAARAVDRALQQLDRQSDVEQLRNTVLQQQSQAEQDAATIADLKNTNRRVVDGDLRFGRAEQNAALQDAKRQLQIVDLTPGTWKRADKAVASDAVVDAALWLADLKSTGSAKTLHALQKKLDHNASKESVGAADQKLGVTASWVFADGSKVQLKKDDDGNDRVHLRSDDGRKIALDLDKVSPFTLPLTNDPGPTAAMLDAKTLSSATAAQELKKLGFTPITDRYFLHKDGSWAAIVDGAGSGRPGVRVAAGKDDRRYDLDAPATSRANAYGALPPWVQSMIRLSPPAENVDLQLMSRQLAALDETMLKKLHAAGYVFDVTRCKISNAQADLKDISIVENSTQQLVDNAGAMHRAGGNQRPSIIVRTGFDDGQLRLDLSTLLGAIGHAFDGVIGDGAASRSSSAGQAVAGAARRKDPLHVEPDFVDAYTKEHTRLPQFFHQQDRFVAETFALFMLDPVRCKRQFPLAHACHEKRFADLVPDAAKLLDVERGFDKDAVVNVAGRDLRELLAQTAQQNAVLKENGVPTRPVVVHLDGDVDFGAAGYVKDAARHLRNSFGKDAGAYRRDESFVTVTPALFNNAADLEKLLTEIETSGRPAVLYVENARNLAPSSAGFAVWNDFIARGRDLPPLVLGGDAQQLASLDVALPSVMRLNTKIDPLTPAQQATALSRMAAQDGFLLAPGVVEAVTKKLKGGGLEAAAELWRAIKGAQFARQLSTTSAQPASASSLREVIKADVDGAKLEAKKTPQEKLDAMIGQAAVKRQISTILGEAKVAALRDAQGLQAQTPLRLNLLFSGAPGTGKTTYAEILGGLLQEVGYIKNPTVTKVTIQDLLTGSPEQAIKSLFESNRGGVIFIDEMHQLKDTEEGRRAFRAMIPLLSDAKYQDTVFIGAGYADELGELVKNVDKGAERRFTSVNFLDYSKDELGTILDGKAKDQQLTMDKKTREAAMAFLDFRKRTTKNFGNAGEIDVALAHARKAQTLRITQLDPAKVDKKTLMALVPEDFAVPAPITRKQFWDEMNQMSGWDEVKAELQKMAASIEGAEKRGKPAVSVVEPYWIVDGPPGTGKSTLAGLLSKFGAAYGLTAVPEVVDVQGANFQGEFVGQTAGVVQKQFERAWGRLMFVDEVSGLAKSGGDFKYEAAKIILAQTENNRGKFMMVVADYAENINQFLKLDPGLPRRFGNRLTLQPWTPQQATDDLVKKLKTEGVDVDALRPALEKHFAKLVKTPGYASGGDVRTLKGAIVALLDADANAKPKDVVDDAFAALIDKKKKDAA